MRCKIVVELSSNNTAELRCFIPLQKVLLT